MNCPSCGDVFEENSSYCPKCGLGLHAASPMQGDANWGNAQTKPRWSVVASLAGLFLALILLAIFTREYARSHAIAYSIGAAIGTVLLPTIGVVLYYRNRAAATSRVLFVLSMWWFFALMVTSYPLQKGFTKDDVPQLARQAVGKEAVTDADEERELVRGFFRIVRSENEAYVKEVNGIDPAMGQLALAQSSFKDAATMDKMIGHFEALVKIEQGHEERVKALLVEFTREMDKLNWTDAKKEQFRTGAAQGFSQQLKKRAPVYESEMAFMNGALDLYRYARSHAKAFKAQEDGTVAVNDSVVLAEFNRQVELVNAKRNEYLSRQELFDSEQKKAVEAMGLTMEDLGVKEAK